jgi:hypothetical protein
VSFLPFRKHHAFSLWQSPARYGPVAGMISMAKFNPWLILIRNEKTSSRVVMNRFLPQSEYRPSANSLQSDHRDDAQSLQKASCLWAMAELKSPQTLAGIYCLSSCRLVSFRAAPYWTNPTATLRALQRYSQSRSILPYTSPGTDLIQSCVALLVPSSCEGSKFGLDIYHI